MIVTLGTGELRAELSADGAELLRLVDARGHDWLWDGDPRWWSGRAPLLFPVVGRVHDDHVLVDGRRYPMPRHGFARRRRWQVSEADESHAVFELADDTETRTAYPFAFRLRLEVALADATLTMTATLANLGAAPLPASFGFHPAFRWPLPGGEGPHTLTFERDEPSPLAHVTAKGLLGPADRPSPLVGRTLPLDHRLFAHDALVWTTLASRRVRYAAANGAAVEVAFPDLPYLGVWTKPGAPFLCIEPWAGHADPDSWRGELRDKPGITLLPPGAARSWTMAITVVPGSVAGD